MVLLTINGKPAELEREMPLPDFLALREINPRHVAVARNGDVIERDAYGSVTLRAGFVQITQARSDWAPDPANPMPTFATPRRVPHGVTLIGRLFDEGTVARAGLALERAFGVAGERPAGF